MTDKNSPQTNRIKLPQADKEYLPNPYSSHDTEWWKWMHSPEDQSKTRTSVLTTSKQCFLGNLVRAVKYEKATESRLERNNNAFIADYMIVYEEFQYNTKKS